MSDVVDANFSHFCNEEQRKIFIKKSQTCIKLYNVWNEYAHCTQHKKTTEMSEKENIKRMCMIIHSLYSLSLLYLLFVVNQHEKMFILELKKFHFSFIHIFTYCAASYHHHHQHQRWSSEWVPCSFSPRRQLMFILQLTRTKTSKILLSDEFHWVVFISNKPNR